MITWEINYNVKTSLVNRVIHMISLRKRGTNKNVGYATCNTDTGKDVSKNVSIN